MVFGATVPLRENTMEEALGWLKCCFTSTETVGLLGTGDQDGHLDFHTAPELWKEEVWSLLILGRFSYMNIRRKRSL